jgi:hypothetical protein
MVVKYRPLLAECRHIVGVFFSQILHDVDCAPSQHQARTQKQQQTNCKMHRGHRTLEAMRNFKFPGLFPAVGTTLIILSASIRSGGWVHGRQYAAPQLAKTDADGAWPLTPAAKNYGVAVFQEGALFVLTDRQRLAAALAELDQ